MASKLIKNFWILFGVQSKRFIIGSKSKWNYGWLGIPVRRIRNPVRWFTIRFYDNWFSNINNGDKPELKSTDG